MVATLYGREGLAWLVLLTQVRPDKVEGCLIVDREVNDLGEV